MKRGRPVSGGSSRNTNYYVKKFRPSKSGETSITNFFKSVNSSSDKVDHPIENFSSTVLNESAVLRQEETTSQHLITTEICVATNTENAISPIKPSENSLNEEEHSLKNDLNEVIKDDDDDDDSDYSDDDENNISANQQIDQKYIKNYEKEYNWLYYSHSAAGFLCKVCSVLSNSTSNKAWETVGVDIKKNGHPNRVCKKHAVSKRHKLAVAAQEENKKIEIQKSISDGAEAANLTKINFNRKVIGKFVKLLYFMIRKQWAVSENFESLVRFLGDDLEDGEIKKHLESCGKNATYLSHISVENIMNSISVFLEQELLTRLACADFFSIMADECTDQSQREQLGLVIRYRLPGDTTVEEKYFGLVNLTNSSAEAITKAIEKICIAKNVDITKCVFIALDGANVMSGEHSGVQRRIKHLSPHCSYVNCRNHKLALVFVHLLKKYNYLKAVDSLLISLWKLFHYSPKKSAVFKEIQENVYSVDVLKVLKVSTTRWMSHGHACERVSARYEQLLESLDSLFAETQEPELKGLREQLLDPKIILTILFLADFLGKVNVLNLWLQSSDVQFSLLNDKVKKLIEEVEKYCSNLEDGQNFKKNKVLLDLASECTSLSLKVRGRSQPEAILKEFKEQFVKDFLNDFKTEIGLAFNLTENVSFLKGFDIFSNLQLNEITDDNKQSDFDDCLSVLVSHYGEQQKSNFQGGCNLSNPIIDKVAIETEKGGFKNELLLAKMNFDIEKTKAAQQFLYQNKKEDAKKALDNRITPNAVQTFLEKESKNWILFPNFMKLLSLCTIMPSSTASVERLFSRLNLLCTDLRSSLKQESLDMQLRIIVNGPPNLSQQQCEEIIDIFKMTGNRRILL